MLEAHAVTLSLRWLLRSVRRHSRRTVLLIDATAVCGAVAKGRSSSPTLKHEIKQIAALAIAGDLWVRVVYIPSEDNPSNAPSRGVVRTWRRQIRQRYRPVSSQGQEGAAQARFFVMTFGATLTPVRLRRGISSVAASDKTRMV